MKVLVVEESICDLGTELILSAGITRSKKRFLYTNSFGYPPLFLMDQPMHGAERTQRRSRRLR
jgi:hypothetical protein